MSAKSKAIELERKFLVHAAHLSRVTSYKKDQIGTKSLAYLIRELVEDCDSISYKGSMELLEIADEMDKLN